MREHGGPQVQHDRPSHVFVVGLSRTGSTLTRRVLNASPLVGMGGESLFFSFPTRLGLSRRHGFRERFAALGDLATDEGLRRVVEAILKLDTPNFWARLSSLVSRDEFDASIRAMGRTDRALLAAAMTAHARGKPIHGEKTPHHIYSVPRLLEWFPEARVIHTFRDPRAIYVSVRRKESPKLLTQTGLLARRLGPLFELYAMTNAVFSWRRMIALNARYQAAFPDRYLLVRFEDLIGDPRGAVQQICAFLAIPFSEKMLEQVVVNSSYLPRGSIGEVGFDRNALDRWRDHLSPFARWWFARLCGRHLAEFGYGQ